MREAVAALWAVWCFYQIAQTIAAPKDTSIGVRLGYLTGAILSASTSYLLVTP